MNELVTCIRLIKMYAWEKTFAKSILGRTHGGLKERLPLEWAPRRGSYGSRRGHGGPLRGPAGLPRVGEIL